MHLFTGIHLFSEIHLINKIHLYRTQNGKICTISIAIQLLNAKSDEEIKLLRSKNEAQVFVDKVYLSILTFNRSEIVSTAFKIKISQHTGLVKPVVQQKAPRNNHCSGQPNLVDFLKQNKKFPIIKKNKSACLGSSKLKTSKNCYKPVKPQKQKKIKVKIKVNYLYF